VVLAYQRIVEVEPNNVDGHRKLAGAYVKLGQLQAALSPYQQAVLLAPTDAGIRFELGMCYARLGNRRAAMSQVEMLRSLDAQRANELLRAVEG